MRIYIDILMQVFFINSLLIFGIYAITGKGMILGFLQRWGTENKPCDNQFFVNGEYQVDVKTQSTMWSKPLFNCPPCMASIWGTAGFIYAGIGWEYWIVWVLSLAGFNYIVNKMLDK